MLTLRAADAGDYQLLIRAVPGGGEWSASAWELPLRRAGSPASEPADGPADQPIEDRFEPVPLGPGHHLIQLRCRSAGDILLECAGLRRTGAMSEVGGGERVEPGERAFLGVEIGAPRQGGVMIRRAVPDTAAARAGITKGDVVLRFGSVETDTVVGLQEAIAARRPGDRIMIDLIRAGERITTQVEIGRRSDAPNRGAERAAHVVEMLDVRSGQTIADIGCGAGWLSEAIAEALGGDGTVYAVEIQERHVRRLRRQSMPGVVPVFSAPDDVSLPENSLDTAMLHDVASHIDREARQPFYRSLTRSLKPGGRLVVFGPHGKSGRMLEVLRENGFIPVDGEALAGLSAERLDERLQEGIVFRPRSSEGN